MNWLMYCSAFQEAISYLANIWTSINDFIGILYCIATFWPASTIRGIPNPSHGTIEPFDTNLFWSNKHETPK